MLKIKGFDELQKKLNNLQKRAEDLNGTRNIPLEELISNSFMSEHTSFNSLDELFESSGFEIQTAEDFKNIPSHELDDYISKTTNFSSWKDMLNSATKQYYIKELDI